MTSPRAAIYRITSDPAAPSLRINVGPVWNASNTRDVETMSDAEWRASFPDTGVPNIVRVGRRPTDLFCISGVGPEGDQFKSNYETAGYRGLVFELVWQDPGADAQ